jgi:hypothetical protein
MAQDPSEVVTITKDGGLIVAPAIQDSNTNSAQESSIRVPQADTSLGADFGENVTDDDRLFAATREPIAGFLIYFHRFVRSCQLLDH